MKKKVIKGLIATTGVLFVSGGVLLGSNIIEKTNDVTPPYGRIEIKGAKDVNNVNYVDRTSVTVDIYAKDDLCKDEDIKYYITTEPISDTEKLNDSLWKNYVEGTTETITLPSVSSTNTIYAIFKDKNGNTSKIYTGETAKHTIIYDANGGENAPTVQTTYIGMSSYVTKEKPTNGEKYFAGWSTNKNATEAELFQGDLLSANTLENDITLYAVWTDEINNLPKLADVVKVGDYVNYPVHYDNVFSYNGQYLANLKGWRVLSIEEDGTVNLVSAGIPLTYHHYNNAETSIKNLTLNFLNIPFSTSTNYTFRSTGFNPYMTLSEVFDNKYTARYEVDTEESYTSTYNDGTVVTYTGTKNAGDLKVRSITKEDLDIIYDPTGATVTAFGESVTAAKYEKLLAIPCSDKTSNYGVYWLASAYSSNDLRYVDDGGYVRNRSYYLCGVRPVVSLKSTVKTTGTDMVGAWNIELAK